MTDKMKDMHDKNVKKGPEFDDEDDDDMGDVDDGAEMRGRTV